MTGPLRALAVALALLLAWAAAAFAHDVRLAYLQIDQMRSGSYSLIWRTPVLSGAPLPVVLSLSEEAETVSPPRVQSLPGSLIERRVIQLPGGLAGQRIGFVGLEATITDVLVRIGDGDGDGDGGYATELVRPSRCGRTPGGLRNRSRKPVKKERSEHGRALPRLGQRRSSDPCSGSAPRKAARSWARNDAGGPNIRSPSQDSAVLPPRYPGCLADRRGFTQRAAPLRRAASADTTPTDTIHGPKARSGGIQMCSPKASRNQSVAQTRRRESQLLAAENLDLG